jgi:tetratricopeptide (TPR) repeat protein/transglutaminase-like putative cysteine protease
MEATQIYPKEAPSMRASRTRSPLFTSAVFAFVCAAMAVDATHGQEPVWPLVGPAFQASVADVQKAAIQIVPEKFMETTVLFERDSYRIDAEGRVTYRHSLIFRIETQAGVEDWAETSARYAPWYQNQPSIQARVILPDGRVSQLDPKTVIDGPASDDDDNVYTDERIRKAPLPALAIGAIVEEETVTEDRQPFFAGGGVYRDYASRTVPIVRSELLIDAPSTLKLQYRVHHLETAKFSESEQDGVRHLQFVQGYLPARADSDITLATHDDLSPMIEFSTGVSWAAVVNAYLQLAEAHIDPDKVKGLLPSSPAATRLEEIKDLVARLHREIRYTGIEFGQASLQPAPAADVIKHHYGDCKDKAAVLVAMLRAVGIPANIALLDSGPGRDVTVELPGMNEFDHAIVYVAADGKGAPALWIDATAEYTQVGWLPRMDQGRQALIIAEGTTSLTTTPEFKPEEDRLTEVREVDMAPYGPAHIAETSLTEGSVDADYRSDFGEADTREKRKGLEDYARDQYLAKALTRVERGDGKDLAKPFVLKLDMAEAKRGNTLIEDAALAIPFSGIFYRLPDWFRTDPKLKGEKLTPQQEDDRKRAVAARAVTYDVHPFLVEWRYRITPPEGFILRALPEDKKIEMGPALLTQHYEQGAQGIITADLRFSTGKPHYSVDEALALRDAVLAAYKEDMITILFDQQGSKLMAAGKIREALAADRALIDQHPAQALQHAQMAYALLKAGMGDQARAEALRATQLDPKSAVAFKALGWVCQFSAIGIQYSQGFDWDCATAAYRKALELDPDDSNNPISLGVLDEYDRNGDRYSPHADLADAVRLFRSLLDKDKEAGEPYQNNLLYDLLYSNQYKALLQELDKLPSSVNRDALGISATVALEGGQKGIAAGIARADHLAAGADGRKAALAAAGNQLLYLRMYPEAAEILSASVAGQSDSASTTQRVSLFRQLTRWDGDFLPATDPRGVVQHMVLAAITGKLDDKLADELLARHAYGSALEWQRNVEKYNHSRGMLHAMAEASSLPANVLLDLIVGNLKLSVEGDDSSGYKVTMHSLGAKAQSFFVVRENGRFKIVTDGTTPSEAGNEALYLLSIGQDSQARSLLDWMRDRMHKGGGDDPLSGPLLPRFWTVGDAADRKAMASAAASLVAGNPGIRELLPALQTDWKNATKEQERLNLELLLGAGYRTVQDGAALKAIGSELIAKYPDSYVTIEFEADADAMLKDWSNSNSILAAQLARHPDDENLLRLKARTAEAQGDFVQARATRQKLFDNGKATSNDYNGYAWTALFDNKIDADVVKAAQQANMLTHNSSFSELHTLACIYASEGRTAEARDLLLKAMSVANLSEPNSEVWYVLGSIYEQYGVNDAAIEAYRKVEQPEGRIYPASTWLLAQARLKTLGAS